MMTPEEFAAKIEFEDGIVEALEYGLRETDLDDSDPHLKADWARLRQIYDEHFEPMVRRVEEQLQKYAEVYDEEWRG